MKIVENLRDIVLARNKVSMKYSSHGTKIRYGSYTSRSTVNVLIWESRILCHEFLHCTMEQNLRNVAKLCSYGIFQINPILTDDESRYLGPCLYLCTMRSQKQRSQMFSYEFHSKNIKSNYKRGYVVDAFYFIRS